MSVNTILSSKISDTGSEPVSVEQAKLHAAIDYTDYDSILPIYLSAARQSIEKATGQALVSKKVNLTVALYAGNVFKPPHSAGQYPSGERSECEHTCWDPCYRDVKEENYSYLLG